MDTMDKIIKLRKEAKLTQRELAEKLDVNPSHLNRLEKRKYQPSLDMLKKFAEFFGVSADYLLSDGDEFSDVNIENKTLNERVRLIEKLDEEDQKALIHIIEKMLTNKRMKELLNKPALTK